jgi:hypothetical protein
MVNMVDIHQLLDESLHPPSWRKAPMHILRAPPGPPLVSPLSPRVRG